MKVLLSLLLANALLVGRDAAASQWKMKDVSIPTRWAASVSPQNVWPEYPRPQMQRSEWQSLNGLWQYAVVSKDAAFPSRYQGHILVPYPLESALSGVKKALEPDQLLWYRRSFMSRSRLAGERTLLHFGAVDYEATVYVNSKLLGSHSGGYQSFTFDVTDQLKDGANELVVRVYDPTNKGPNPHGKQTLNSEFMMYTPSSGIWQTVWLERVPSTYIEKLTMTPDVDHGSLSLQVGLQGAAGGYTLEAIVRSSGHIVARSQIQGQTELHIDHPHLWSPDDPYLYDLQVRLLRGGAVVDSVQSYFGMRKIEVKDDAQRRPRIFLNDTVTYNLGVVDQGFWPDGLYTPASDAALKFDLQSIKALGFNTVRKHIKIEPERWYMYCDRLGLLVWQDMPSSNNDTPEARKEFEKEIQDNLAQLHNHPSITTWILFNEGWGTYDQERLARWMKQEDGSRLVNGMSGPYDQIQVAQFSRRLDASETLRVLSGDVGSFFEAFQSSQYHNKWLPVDLADLHYYPGPRMFPPQKGAASVTGEHGSFGVFIEGHVLDDLKLLGVGLGGMGLTPQQMLKAYADGVDRLKELELEGLSGSNYFEITDVEAEQQGFLTYDREIAKVPVADIAQVNSRLVPRAKNYASATAGFSVRSADRTPEQERYKELVAQYARGKRDLPFLRRLALMALRQKDPTQAATVGDSFIKAASRPYTRDTWGVITALTQSSRDRGFELLRTHASEVDQALGPQAGEKKLVEVIRRETIKREPKTSRSAADWTSLEKTVSAQYGDLGREVVLGAKMMSDWEEADWEAFGKSYAQYFGTALTRSFYPLDALSYQVFLHVRDKQVIQHAMDAMKWKIDSDKADSVFGRYDPTELDTYANLIYKLGKSTEALKWQRLATELSGGRDQEIATHLDEMKAGKPTWALQ